MIHLLIMAIPNVTLNFEYLYVEHQHYHHNGIARSAELLTNKLLSVLYAGIKTQYHCWHELRELRSQTHKVSILRINLGTSD